MFLSLQDHGGARKSGAKVSGIAEGLGLDGHCGATSNYNQASATVSIAVNYQSGGSCLGDLSHSILQPVNVDGSSVFKKGSTVPAKFRVCNAAGASVGSAGVVTSFRLIGTSAGTVGDISESVISTTPDTDFRWDASAQQWIFNVSTKNLNATITYYYRITLNEGSSIDFHYGLK